MYRKLCDHALRAKKAGKTDAATFGVVEKLLTAVPDVSTLWNYRREMLLARGELDAGPELALTATCLRKQPKSYPSAGPRRKAGRLDAAATTRITST